MSELARINPADAILEPVERRADTDSWIEVVAEVSRLAGVVAATEFVPRGLRGSAPAVAAAILYGREVGLPPMTALSQTHVIEGKPAISAEAMRALVLAAGHDLVFAETTGALCTMRARRRGSQEWTALTWTIDMARAANLSGPAWKSYPRAMLQARCTTELVRMVFPDVIHGFRSVEEMEDGYGTPGTPAAAPGGTSGTTTVQRATRVRQTRRKTPEPAVAHTTDTETTGPPLPGEPGYDPPDDGGEDTPASPPSPDQPPPGPADAPPHTPADDPTNDPTGPEATAGTPPARMVTRPQIRTIFKYFSDKFGLGDEQRDERLHLTGRIIGRPLESSNDLTVTEAQTVIDTLILAPSLDRLHEITDPGQPPLIGAEDDPDG